MSGLSLREARTKRQKAKVYKSSRSEFRSTLNNARNDHSPENDGSSKDDKVGRRKIMKVDRNYNKGDPQGEGSNGVGEGDKMVTDDKIIDADGAAQGKGDKKSDEDKDDEIESGTNNLNEKNGGKNDDDNDDENFDGKKTDGNRDTEFEEDPKDDIDGGPKDEKGDNDNQNSDNGKEKNDVREEMDEDETEVADDQKAETSGRVKTGNPYEDYCTDDEPDPDDSDAEDYYEFLSQDGGDAFDLDYRFGDDDEDEDDDGVRNTG